MYTTRLIAAAAPLIVGLAACGGNDPSPVERVMTYERLHNEHDVAATMDLFAPDAVFEAVGLANLKGIDAIRAIHEYDTAIDAQLSFDDCRADGRTVTCAVLEQNRWMQTAGLGDVNYPSSVITFDDDGQITHIASTMSPEDGAAMGGIFEQFVPWIYQERPDSAAKLFDDSGTFIYGEANGYLVLDLLAQWRAAAGT